VDDEVLRVSTQADSDTISKTINPQTALLHPVTAWNFSTESDYPVLITPVGVL
jgi:hypothetical protein